MCIILIKPSSVGTAGGRDARGRFARRKPGPPVMTNAAFLYAAAGVNGGKHVGVAYAKDGKVVIERFFSPMKNDHREAIARIAELDRAGHTMLIHIRSAENGGLANTHPFHVGGSNETMALCQNGYARAFGVHADAMRCDTRVLAEDVWRRYGTAFRDDYEAMALPTHPAHELVRNDSVIAVIDATGRIDVTYLGRLAPWWETEQGGTGWYRGGGNRNGVWFSCGALPNDQLFPPAQ